MKVIKRMLTMNTKERKELTKRLCHERTRITGCPAHLSCYECAMELLDEEYVEPKKKYVLEIEKPNAGCDGCPLRNRNNVGECLVQTTPFKVCPLREETK